MENDTLLNLMSVICNTIADTEKKNIKKQRTKSIYKQISISTWGCKENN